MHNTHRRFHIYYRFRCFCASPVMFCSRHEHSFHLITEMIKIIMFMPQSVDDQFAKFFIWVGTRPFSVFQMFFITKAGNCLSINAHKNFPLCCTHVNAVSFNHPLATRFWFSVIDCFYNIIRQTGFSAAPLNFRCIVIDDGNFLFSPVPVRSIRVFITFEVFSCNFHLFSPLL